MEIGAIVTFLAVAAGIAFILWRYLAGGIRPIHKTRSGTKIFLENTPDHYKDMDWKSIGDRIDEIKKVSRLWFEEHYPDRKKWIRIKFKLPVVVVHKLIVYRFKSEDGVLVKDKNGDLIPETANGIYTGDNISAVLLSDSEEDVARFIRTIGHEYGHVGTHAVATKEDYEKATAEAEVKDDFPSHDWMKMVRYPWY